MAATTARTIAAASLAMLVCGTVSSGQPQPPATPVVAIVLTDGKLLPLAVRPASEWQMLPWPRHELAESPTPPSIPANAAAIPKEWFTPLSTLPATWRLQPINGQPTAIHTAAPTHWQIATFDAVGLATDYVDPDPAQRSFDYNAGIAVSGNAESLPVRELDEASPEWAHLVARHVKAFLNADRADAHRRGVRLKGRTTVTATKELRAGDVSLYRVELEPKRAFEYFEVVVQRPGGADPGRPVNCATASIEYRGVIEQKGRTETVKWLTGEPPICGDPPAVAEVVGGLRSPDGVRFVLEMSGDDWQSFAIVNPAGPAFQVKRAPRPAGPLVQ
jgi:hypothetical protein